MATNILPIYATGVRPSAVSRHRSSDNPRRKPSISGNGNWWSPLFGWSSNADYIDSSSKTEDQDPIRSSLRSEKHPDQDPKPAKPKFVRGCFTEEKAKQLRMKMAMESGNFHDVMYHSAIASRLASDFSRRKSVDR